MLNLWANILGASFALGAYFLGAVKFTKKFDLKKYKYSGYGIGFDARRSFSLSNSSEFDENVILILCKSPTEGFDSLDCLDGLILLWLQRKNIV